MESEQAIILQLQQMNVLLSELIHKTQPVTNSSMIQAYDTSVTTEKRFDAHELMGVPKEVKILSITALDIGGGLTVRVNGDTTPMTMANGDSIDKEIIESIGLVGGGAGTAYIRYTFYIPRV